MDRSELSDRQVPPNPADEERQARLLCPRSAGHCSSFDPYIVREQGPSPRRPFLGRTWSRQAGRRRDGQGRASRLDRVERRQLFLDRRTTDPEHARQTDHRRALPLYGQPRRKQPYGTGRPQTRRRSQDGRPGRFTANPDAPRKSPVGQRKGQIHAVDPGEQDVVAPPMEREQGELEVQELGVCLWCQGRGWGGEGVCKTVGRGGGRGGLAPTEGGLGVDPE